MTREQKDALIEGWTKYGSIPFNADTPVWCDNVKRSLTYNEIMAEANTKYGTMFDFSNNTVPGFKDYGYIVGHSRDSEDYVVVRDRYIPNTDREPIIYVGINDNVNGE